MMEPIAKKVPGIFTNKCFYSLLITGILINASGLFVTILEPDGALYASIAKTIAVTGDFVNLAVHGQDWLDKPHFPFWMAAISYKIFGINTFAYKFPAFLFWALGILYTYLLAADAYGKKVAQCASLLYVSAAHLVVSNNDVRAEPYLTGLLIGSMFHFFKSTTTRPYLHITLASMLASFAVMTKGPFILIIIGAGFFIDWIVKKKWKEFVRPTWWVAVVLVAVFILPELYCLHVQFDMHPEKVVFNRTGVSGVRFFFWDSQFGRFFNNGPIKGNGNYFFYLHTTLWAFLPWSLVLVAALLCRIRHFRVLFFTQQAIVLGAALTGFVLFSLSGFQLPHYINILFPLFSIISAEFLVNGNQNGPPKWMKPVQITLGILMLLLVLGLSYLFQKKIPLLYSLAAIGILLLPVFLGRIKVQAFTIVFGFFSSGLVYLYLNLSFYPALLQYQSGSQAAFYVNKFHTSEDVFIYRNQSYSLDFYSNKPVRELDTRLQLSQEAPVLVFVEANELQQLTQMGYSTEVLQKFPHFHISQLSTKFINQASRKQVIKNYVVARVATLRGR
jgi:4-amino-4-deoxy-L-arabinose transferase-like glycosyltransferase